MKKDQNEPFPWEKRPGPQYRMLADTLRDAIAASRYRVDEYLPSERALAEEYRVTRITVRGALSILEKEGLLFREPHRCSKVIATPSDKGQIDLLFFKWQSPFADPILADLCEGVAESTQQLGYKLGLFSALDNETFIHRLDSLMQAPPRGLVVVGSYESYGPTMQQIEAMAPTVLIGTPHGSLKADVIEPDFEGAMSLAMSHLYSMGYRRLKLLTGGFPEEEGRDQRNLAAFQQAGLQFGFAAPDLTVFSTREKTVHKLKPHEGAGLWVDESVFDDLELPAGIVATAPSFAHKMLTLALEKGLRVPEDLAIISTQDSRTLAQASVPISAVEIYSHTVGMRAVNCLVERLGNPGRMRRIERGELTLVARGSCGEPSSMIREQLPLEEIDPELLR